MDLQKKVTLYEEDKSIELPLENLLRLLLVYMEPLKSEWETEVAEKDIKNFQVAKTVLEDYFAWLKKKLGINPGDQVLL